MDRITKSLVDEYSSSSGFSGLSESKEFEHFVSSLVVGTQTGDSIDTYEVVTGQGGDTGIDAIGVVVNGVLVNDPDTVDDLADTNNFIDAVFVFVQSKTSSSFAGSDIGQFGYGVLDFFKENPSIARSEDIRAKVDIVDRVFLHSTKFKRGNPSLRLYYATTGTWKGEPDLVSRMSSIETDLVQLNLFRECNFTSLGASELQKLYRASKNAISREFNFPDRMALPDIPGVKEAHLGFVPASEFIKLIEGEAGGILKTIFYDNVRDWQDYNSVNSEIRETLSDTAENSRFVLMNNGITIIAKSTQATGTRMMIEDYQIVNGCQTSHVLFNNQSEINSSTNVPLRVISTEDEAVVNSIVKATNRQTQVRAEQLIALSDFQKQIESYFVSFPSSKKLFYERRLKQYSSESGIEKTRIVTPSNLIRSFASVIREEPHRTTRSYRTLLIN